jgi:hypothetical protein
MLPRIHNTITVRTLRRFFSPKTLEVISNANLDSDGVKRIYSGTITNHFITAQHVSDGNISGAAKFISTLQQNATDLLASAINSSKEKQDEIVAKALYSLGRMFHAIQDVYAHTNWVDLAKQNNMEGIIWNENPFAPNIKGPFKSCRFRIFRELGCALGNVLQKLFPGIYKHPDFYDKYYLRPDASGKMVAHLNMNFDTPGTVHDIAYRQKYGTSGFSAAVKYAQKHTREKWLAVQQDLRERLGIERAGQLFEMLRTWNPSQKFVDKRTISIGRKSLRGNVNLFAPEFVG